MDTTMFMLNTGKGWFGDRKRHVDAGRKGGMSTAKSYGAEFYSKIGSKGGKVSGGNFKNNPERARNAGRKGGLTRNHR